MAEVFSGITTYAKLSSDKQSHEQMMNRHFTPKSSGGC